MSPAGTDEPTAEHEPDPATTTTDLVVPDGENDDHGPQAISEIEEPARLLRIAAMVQSLLSEVRTTDLDEAGRERLRDVHNRAIEALGELVSDDLREELTDVALVQFDAEAPSAAELRIAQAQLAGWLEGLFRGIQASIANQQLAAQAQLAQMRQQGQGGAAGRGQYL